MFECCLKKNRFKFKKSNLYKKIDLIFFNQDFFGCLMHVYVLMLCNCIHIAII